MIESKENLLSDIENSIVIIKSRQFIKNGKITFDSKKTKILTDNLNLDIEYNDIIGFDIITDFQIKNIEKINNKLIEFKSLFKNEESNNSDLNLVIFKIDFIKLYTYSSKSLFNCFKKKTCNKRKYSNIEFLCLKNTAIMYFNKLKNYTNFELIVKLKDTKNNKSDVHKDSLDFFVIRKKLLIIINPFGGKGHGKKIWNKVKYLYDVSMFDYDVLYTQYKNHAYEIVYNLENNKYYGVICCSGDGLLHEVVNALMHRNKSNSTKCLNIIVGIIPAGSGNALAKSLTFEAKEEECNSLTASYLILTGRYRFIDSMEIKLQSRTDIIYSFLSINMAIIADIDLESEKLRYLGPLRFTIYGIWRSLNLRRYKADVIYFDNLNIFDEINNLDIFNISMDQIRDISNKYNFNCNINDYYSYFTANIIPFLGDSIYSHPLSNCDDGYIDILSMSKKTKGSKFRLMKLLINQDTGDYFNKTTNTNTFSEFKSSSNLKDLRCNQGISYIKTKGFLIKPTNPKGLTQNYSIDGERYPLNNALVKIVPSSLKIFGYIK